MDNPFKTLPRPVIIGGIAVTVGGSAFYLYRRKKTTGSYFGSGSSSSAAIDPVTGLPATQDNAIDPQTGLAYLAEAQQYGSVAGAEASVSDYGTGGGTGGGAENAGSAGAGSTTTEPGAVSSPLYLTNAAWSQAVQTGLSAISGDSSYNGTDIGGALGAYLSRQPLTAAQATLVNTAVAEFGPPPVGSYTVTLAPAAGPAPPAKRQVPYLEGVKEDQAGTLISAAGLKSKFTGDAGDKTGTYIVVSQEPKAGEMVAAGTIVTAALKKPESGFQPGG